MACHFVNEQDVLDYTSENTSSINRQESSDQQSSSQLSVSDTSSTKIKLPKGGCQVVTKIGPIQFSMVPETLKDSINMGLEVPNIFVVPQHRFDRRFCLSVAEFEFPAYFSFFVKRKQVILVTDSEGEKAIRNIFQETLLGPLDVQHNDPFSHSDLRQEMDNFSRNPFNPAEKLTIDTLIKFVIFQDSVADLGQGVVIKQSENRILIMENDVVIAKIKDKVDIMVDEQSSLGYIKYGLFSNPNENQSIEHYQEQIFQPPVFGVTILGCSHGFDPKGSVSGYIFWINGEGLLLDPPPFTTLLLKKQGISSRMIRWIVISHCHADHDAGSFQKILESDKVTLITTKIIKDSFVRKYAALTGYTIEYIQTLFHFRPVQIGKTFKINGAEFDFFYSLHSIPCLGFQLRLQNKSIYFSGDTYYDPDGLNALHQKAVISKERLDFLLSDWKWKSDLILHEAGVPPIHTPAKILAQLPVDVKAKIRLIHVASKDVPADAGLQVPATGFENTVVLIDQSSSQLSMIRLISLVENVSLFRTATVTQLRQIFERVNFRSVTKNEVICKENDIGDEFYVIRSGSVRIDSDSDHKFVKYLYYGDYFGEGCFFDQSKRRANATAMCETDLLCLSKSDFLDIFNEDSSAMKQLEHLQENRTINMIIEQNKFFSQLSSNQKIQLEMILTPRRFYKQGSLIQGRNLLATSAFFVYSGCITVTIPDQVHDSISPIKLKKEHSQFKSKLVNQQKRFSLPTPAHIEIQQEQKDIYKDKLKQIKLKPGTFFGEINSIYNKLRTDTYVEANEDSELIFIPADSLIQFLFNNPGLLVLFQESVIIE